MTEGGLEGKVKKYHGSVLFGQLAGLASSAYAAFNPDKIASVIPGVDSLLKYNVNLFDQSINVGLPALVGGFNFLGDQIGFGLSLYFSNMGRYKGFKGLGQFAKDYGNFFVRHLRGYAWSYPAAIGLTAGLGLLGFLTGPMAAIAPWAIETVLTAYAYFRSTRHYRREAHATPH